MVRRFDDTRLVHYEGVVTIPASSKPPISRAIYTFTVKDSKSICAEGDKRPYIECEYSHAEHQRWHRTGTRNLPTRKDCGYQGGFMQVTS